MASDRRLIIPRTITLNYARLSSNPQTAFDLTTGQGAINAAYVVGTYTDTQVTDPQTQAVSTQTDLADCPGVAKGGTIRIPLGPTDTPAAKLHEMILGIMAQEGLDLAAGDRFYSVGGDKIAP